MIPASFSAARESDEGCQPQWAPATRVSRRHGPAPRWPAHPGTDNIARKNDDAAGASAEHADGFSRFRQVTQTPVNVVLELRP
jgi:hypothetical protein